MGVTVRRSCISSFAKDGEVQGSRAASMTEVSSEAPLYGNCMSLPSRASPSLCFMAQSQTAPQMRESQPSSSTTFSARQTPTRSRERTQSPERSDSTERDGELAGTLFEPRVPGRFRRCVNDEIVDRSANPSDLNAVSRSSDAPRSLRNSFARIGDPSKGFMHGLAATDAELAATLMQLRRSLRDELKTSALGTIC